MPKRGRQGPHFLSFPVRDVPDWRYRCGPAPFPTSLLLPASGEERAYLAGLLDGEGMIYFDQEPDRRHPRVMISIANTDHSIMSWLGRFGGRVQWSMADPKATKPCGTWTIHAGADTAIFLQAVLPYLLAKREKAMWAIALTWRRFVRRYGAADA